MQTAANLYSNSGTAVLNSSIEVIYLYISSVLCLCVNFFSVGPESCGKMGELNFIHMLTGWIPEVRTITWDFFKSLWAVPKPVGIQRSSQTILSSLQLVQKGAARFLTYTSTCLFGFKALTSWFYLREILISRHQSRDHRSPGNLLLEVPMSPSGGLFICYVLALILAQMLAFVTTVTKWFVKQNWRQVYSNWILIDYHSVFYLFWTFSGYLYIFLKFLLILSLILLGLDWPHIIFPTFTMFCLLWNPSGTTLAFLNFDWLIDYVSTLINM